jgi:hypothetical protein
MQAHYRHLPKSGAKVVRYYQIENKINAALMYELAGEIPLIAVSGPSSK